MKTTLIKIGAVLLCAYIIFALVAAIGIGVLAVLPFAALAFLLKGR